MAGEIRNGGVEKIRSTIKRENKLTGHTKRQIYIERKN